MLKPYIKAFSHAFAGIVSFVKTERNAKVHLVATVVVSTLGFYLKLMAEEWLWIASAIASVLICEMINTAIEKLCNKITMAQDADIKVIKDIAAGFVVLATLYAVIVGTIIFTPHLF